MVAGLQEIDAIVADEIDKSMLLRHASRPTSLKVEFQGFGFSRSFERITQNGLDEIENSQILSELGFGDQRHVLAVTTFDDVGLSSVGDLVAEATLATPP